MHTYWGRDYTRGRELGCRCRRCSSCGSRRALYPLCWEQRFDEAGCFERPPAMRHARVYIFKKVVCMTCSKTALRKLPVPAEPHTEACLQLSVICLIGSAMQSNAELDSPSSECASTHLVSAFLVHLITKPAMVLSFWSLHTMLNTTDR